MSGLQLTRSPNIKLIKLHRNIQLVRELGAGSSSLGLDLCSARMTLSALQTSLTLTCSLEPKTVAQEKREKREKISKLVAVWRLKPCSSHRDKPKLDRLRGTKIFQMFFVQRSYGKIIAGPRDSQDGISSRISTWLGGLRRNYQRTRQSTLILSQFMV